MGLDHVLVAVLLYLSAPAGAGPLPEVIRHKYNPAVLAWVSESSAFDANGRLREAIAAAHTELERGMLQNPNGRCEAFMLEPPMEHLQPDRTVEDVATSSLVALSGNVVHVSRGFFNGFPGTVVGFRVTERLGLRSAEISPKVQPGDIRYTFIGAAQFLTPMVRSAPDPRAR